MSHALAEVMPEWCSDNNSRKSNLSFGEVQPSAAGIGAPYMLSDGAIDYAASLFSGIF